MHGEAKKKNLIYTSEVANVPCCTSYYQKNTSLQISTSSWAIYGTRHQFQNMQLRLS